MLIFLDFVWKLLNDEPTLKSRIGAQGGAHYPLPCAGEGLGWGGNYL